MSRLEWIIGGLFGLVLVAILALGLILLQPEPASSPNIGDPIITVQTAQSSYRDAAEAAAAWADDALLLSASASWPAGSAFAPIEANWSFVFYSASRQATALFPVIGVQAAFLGARDAGTAYQPADISQWQIDSPEAVTELLKRGGQEFIENRGPAGLNLTLSSDGRFTWKASLIAAESGHTFTILLDANSGELLETRRTR